MLRVKVLEACIHTLFNTVAEPPRGVTSLIAGDPRHYIAAILSEYGLDRLQVLAEVDRRKLGSLVSAEARRRCFTCMVT